MCTFAALQKLPPVITCTSVRDSHDLLSVCRLCCLCGTSIMSNPSNMCVSCIRSQVDITAPIQKQVTVLWCKECNRYLQPPKNWVRAELESKELLTFCVKRIKGLQKVLCWRSVLLEALSCPAQASACNTLIVHMLPWLCVPYHECNSSPYVMV